MHHNNVADSFALGGEEDRRVVVLLVVPVAAVQLVKWARSGNGQ